MAHAHGTTYRAYGFGPFFGLAVLVVITVVGGFPLLYAIIERGDWFYAAWLAGLVFIWYQVVRLAFAISVEGDTCGFRSLARRTAVRAQDIETVCASRMGGNVVTVHWRGGKLRLIQPIDGFHEFLAWLKAVNPAVDLRGV